MKGFHKNYAFFNSTIAAWFIMFKTNSRYYEDTIYYITTIIEFLLFNLRAFSIPLFI